MRLLPAIIMLFCIELINAQDTIPDIILKGHQYTVYCTDISKDNQYLVSGGWDNSVKLWDYKNAKEIQLIVHKILKKQFGKQKRKKE